MRPRGPTIGIAAGVLVLSGALVFAVTQVGSKRSSTGKSAPEFAGISTWVNSPPLTMRSLRGKVVWIDFWTYSCINCIRTLPHVREFYARYHRLGLDVIGVHSPEFSFEKSIPNVRAAVARNHLPYPVAMDNAMETWRAFGNQYWPRVYLIDAQGKIRFDSVGEGGEEDLQTHVRALLAETGALLPAPIDFNVPELDAHLTPEIYAGYERGSQQGSLANDQGYEPHVVVDYKAPDASALKLAGPDGAFFLGGKWTADAESITAEHDGARVYLPYRAKNVYMVAAGKMVHARVLIDGVVARSITVDRDDLFALNLTPLVADHVLTLEVGKGFRLYTFTFG